MKWTIHNIYGLIHLITALIAVICAIIILFSTKGTPFHKKMGYIYVVSIVLLNISSFGVMEFFKGQPGPFHFGAIVSIVFTSIGIVPAIRKKGKNWRIWHYYGMNGSVMGLFAAFFVEAVFRSFSSPALVISSIIIISVLVISVGTYLMIKYRDQFFPKPTKQ
jgi:uncharacterized membrane protein